MNTATRIAWTAAGSPMVDGCADTSGICYVCRGSMDRGMPVQKWLGSNYTDQNRAMYQAATHVCDACVLVHAWVAPPGRCAAPGKKRPPNWRMFSHMWEDGSGYSNANKAEKPIIRAFIEREHTGPWFAAIADTGQKHVLPFTPINGPGRSGIVLMDDLRVVVPCDTHLIERMAQLLTDGTTKSALETGRHSPGAFERLGQRLLDFERDEGRFRGSGWFTLALWLAQRDEAEVQRRMVAEKEAKHAQRRAKGKLKGSNSGNGLGAAKRISAKRKRQHSEALGATRVKNASGSSDEQRSRGVGNGVQSTPATGGTEQGVLPGFG